MKDLGLHVLLDLEGCPASLLTDTAKIRVAMKEAAVRAGATIVGEAFHTFSPHGVSGVLLIAESHLSIHTWPELGKATLDVYTCGEAFDANAAADLLVRVLKATCSRRIVVPRGRAQTGVATQIA